MILRRIAYFTLALLMAAGVVAAVLDSATGWFAVFAVAGGAVTAVLLIAIGRRPHASPVAVADRFASEGTSFDTINMSHIRVAGIGGLGMAAVAVAIAYVFPRIGFSLAIGVVGGVVGAVAVILSRSRLGPLGSGRGQIGGRSVLVENPPAPAREHHN
jgi:hypothetical protein